MLMCSFLPSPPSRYKGSHEGVMYGRERGTCGIQGYRDMQVLLSSFKFKRGSLLTGGPSKTCSVFQFTTRVWNEKKIVCGSKLNQARKRCAFSTSKGGTLKLKEDSAIFVQGGLNFETGYFWKSAAKVGPIPNISILSH
jgi:hypothetical protein